MSTRPTIPAEVERQILTECGHRCAVCGTAVCLEIAHIQPWSESEDHNPENLIALCRNCHGLSHQQKWSQRYLREYKDKPWVARHFERHPVSPKHRVKVTVTIETEFDHDDVDLVEFMRSAAVAYGNNRAEDKSRTTNVDE